MKFYVVTADGLLKITAPDERGAWIRAEQRGCSPREIISAETVGSKFGVDEACSKCDEQKWSLESLSPNLRSATWACSYCGKKIISRGVAGTPVDPPSIGKRAAIRKEVQREVWRRDRGRCIECGSNEKLEYDHIIPHSKGGADTVRNIQLLCERCNRRKRDRIG